MPPMNKYVRGLLASVCAIAGFNNIQVFGVCFKCQEYITVVNIYDDVFNG